MKIYNETVLSKTFRVVITLLGASVFALSDGLRIEEQFRKLGSDIMGVDEGIKLDTQLLGNVAIMDVDIDVTKLQAYDATKNYLFLSGFGESMKHFFGKVRIGYVSAVPEVLKTISIQILTPESEAERIVEEITKLTQRGSIIECTVNVAS